jgi:hypothetical protein
MKIKKVNENSSNLSKKEIEDIRNRKFPNETWTEYELWGEDLKYITPDYIMLYTGYSIEECVNYYNSEKNWVRSRVNNFDNIILIEKERSNKILDFEIFKNSKKYNI